MAEMVKNLPAMQETWVPSLGQDNPLEKKYFSLENSMDTGPWQTIVHGHKESDMTE